MPAEHPMQSMRLEELLISEHELIELEAQTGALNRMVKLQALLINFGERVSHRRKLLAKSSWSESRSHCNVIEMRPNQPSVCPKPFKILLVEDNSTDVFVVQSQIEDSRDFHLEAVERVSQAVERLKVEDIDVVLLDFNLPDSIGLEGLIELREHVQRVPVIVLTGIDDEQLGIMALQRGAQDYLIKGEDNARLLRSMRYAIERMKLHGAKDAKAQPGLDKVAGQQSNRREALTDRELEVLKLLGNGCTNQEIAQQLVISLATVKTHISNILQKLSVTDRTKAVIESLKRGLI